MTDTLKIPRPLFPRRQPDAGGRVEHDARGNAIWVRSRATDSIEIAAASTLAILEDSPFSCDRGQLVLPERWFERFHSR
jgi:hypothetical protein